MNIRCKILKQVFANVETGWKALSCVPVGDAPQDLSINSRYGTFTLTGTNLNYLKLGETIDLNIEKDKLSKYSDSYILISMPNMDFQNGSIVINENDELPILERFMTKSQARNVHEAYPHFVQMIMDGKEDEIDAKQIKNVASYRRNKYITDIVNARNYVQLLPTVRQYGLNDVKNSEEYRTPEDFQRLITKNPYHVYIDIYEMSFVKADTLVRKYFENFMDSIERCFYATKSCLLENESKGNTRIKAYDLANMVIDIAPECVGRMPEVFKQENTIKYNENNKYVSLTYTYEAERYIADFIKDKIKNPDITPMDTTDCEVIDGFQLTDEQKAILNVVQNNSIAMLTGASGTGKSSSVKALIRMFEKNHMSYQMLAPTGTAAKVLTRYTARRAMTIHKFICSNEESCFDFYIIDEASMVGVTLLKAFLDKMCFGNKNAKIIFICDPSQLPSISCGNIVENLLQAQTIPIVNLTKTFRYNTSGLITIATDTRLGSSKSIACNKYSDYKFFEIDKNNPLEQIVQCYEEKLKKYNQEDILVLSPFNKYSEGTRAINNAIQDKFNNQDFTGISIKVDKETVKFKIGDKVVNKKNKYNAIICDEYFNDTEATTFIANGDIGEVVNARFDKDTPQMIIKFDDKLVLFEGNDISHLLLGYAISIHAAQGGQARCVIVVIDSVHEILLSRNIEYVAFTRAQEELVLVGDLSAIKHSMKIEQQNDRNTWLYDMLKEDMIG